ncbi:MAG: 3-deoxy-manno-octulosonate cytidylyltransferase [Waddliaceae bacterium]|jgi:3-deoxy-manno-octulosonate cytidylyltransferase (CMP-KDO synthetase)|nr:3-deoxy-manno-octulosonate cytidylyltransferase [Waddliaceae bacterium]MBT3579049.1 3-deoxy-manno-octulosonate cytidylyltransferase [Waddliaceae bacterium]MBT4444482.1 3-deoxy-manno-octulosonate cytidylyltransferase [Waddliaceae bacterium]MBT6929071.1 3-deoxy-manno-octulosonate cytidylyltransferase [Waddliaceae bacterium]MBT7264731.1 3-deoxy-manno-octulosonate cytidylyltransferase [Waddliaceae bacterium]
MKDNSLKTIGIIPARYGSTRFPGKPLALIAGVSLIQRTYENAVRCGCYDKLLVATDDARIYDHVKGFGGEVIMTSEQCPTGTDRVLEAANTLEALDDNDIIVNVQADEPLLGEGVVPALVNALNSDADVATPVTALPEEDIDDPSVVKCVIGTDGMALSFSRKIAPHDDKGTTPTYYKHLGIYAFRYHFLKEFATLAPTPLQQAEDLEQLKILEHGHAIAIAIVEDDGIGVDTPEDITKVEKILCRQNISS